MSSPSNMIFEFANNGSLNFVGKFDELYQTAPDPWDQSGMVAGDMALYYAFSRPRVTDMIAGLTMGKNIDGLEIGCGHGYLTDELSTYITGSRWEGCDISSAAVLRAKQLHPEYTFYVDDITKFGFNHINHTLLYDVVVLGQVWWYILHRLSIALANCWNLLKQDGYLVISQAFLKEQKYGTHIADGFDGTLHRLIMEYNRQFQIVEARYDDSNRYKHNDGLIVLRKLS